MKNFIIGFVVAVLSIVSAALIFVSKLVRRGVRTMPRSTKDYIKSRFEFIDIRKVQDAVACSIKAFVDWAMFGRERSVYESYRPGSYSRYRSWRETQKKDEKDTHPEPYIMDVEEYGCGYIEIQLRYDLSTDKLYDDYDDEEVTSCDFIKDMLKAEDPCLIEPGNYVYIHDPRDGTDYEIDIVEHVDDESKDKED